MAFDPFFVKKLRGNQFKTAYDPMERRYVHISRIEETPEGVFLVYTKRVSDGIKKVYKDYQLTQFS